jgi:hypothetical protein
VVGQLLAVTTKNAPAADRGGLNARPKGIRTPNLLILSARPQKSGCVRYDPVLQRITAAVVHNVCIRKVETGRHRSLLNCVLLTDGPPLAFVPKNVRLVHPYWR